MNRRGLKILISCLMLIAVLTVNTEVFGSTSFTQGKYLKRIQVAPQESDVVLNNPFMGLAPSALHGPYEQPHRLVYAVLTWSELEPEKGQFAFEEIERKYKFDEWNKRGVQVILRFVLDYSSDTRHKDIPDWLYEEIHGDGIWFDEEVGKGFSPNYDNPVLIENHRRVIQKLGERYNKDPRLAYVALGSLGHWGEWHTYSNDEINIPFPKLAVSDQYVQHYLDAFPDKHLLMRRPHPIAKEERLGLFNDMFSSPRSTADFIDWFENGYTSSLAGSEMPPMPDFWRYAPSGGEFGNADRVRTHFQPEGIASIIEMAKRSHTTWLGPSSPVGLDLNAMEQQNLNRFLNTIGYRFVINSVSYPSLVKRGGIAPVQLTVENKGVAPFYYPWPLELSLVDGAGKVVASTKTTADVRNWLPGKTRISPYIKIPSRLPAGDYTLSVAILDPITKQPGVDFANAGRRNDGRYDLGRMTVTKRLFPSKWER